MLWYYVKTDYRKPNSLENVLASKIIYSDINLVKKSACFPKMLTFWGHVYLDEIMGYKRVFI